MRGFGTAAVLVLCLVGCRKTPPSVQASGSTSAVASASSAAPKRGLPAEEDMFRPEEPPPLALAPLPASATTEARAQQLKELLSGQVEAVRLPLAATEGGEAHDAQLFHRLTMEELSPSSEPLAARQDFSFAIGEAQVIRGSGDPARLKRAVSEMRGSFRLCYRDALDEKAAGATANAKAVVVFEIDADGRPSRIRSEGAASKALFECVKQRGMALALDAMPAPLWFRISVETKAGN